MPVEGFGTITLSDAWYNSLYIQAEKSKRSMGDQIAHELQRLGGYKPVQNDEMVEKCKEAGIELPRKLKKMLEAGAP